ncbi:MAG: HAD family hydrolase [Rhodospirillales bacterium]
MVASSTSPISPGGSVDAEGIWRSIRPGAAEAGRGRPALFLDRDGVVNVDHGYVHRLDDLDMIPGAAELIAAANRRGLPVVIVTNQSGVGRGYFGWAEFTAFQSEIERRLLAAGAWIDAAFACPFHADAAAPHDVPDHPCRKPNPGMIHAAATVFASELAASWIVGDRPGDMLAGDRAGLAGGVLIGAEAPGRLRDTFDLRIADDTVTAAQLVPLIAD